MRAPHPAIGAAAARGWLPAIAQPAPRAGTKRRRNPWTAAVYWLRRLPPLPLLLWAALWLNLNSGFWNIQLPQSPDDWQLLIRAVLPFGALPLAIFALILHPGMRNRPSSAPSRLLMIYGLLAAVASVSSPAPWYSLYWSVTFLGTIATAWTFTANRNPLESSRRMLQLTWALTFLVAGIIAYTTRDVVFTTAGTGYGIIGELQGQSRSSGVARWAAVPGLVSLVRAFHTRRPWLIAFFLATAGVAFFIVYRMQSRGAVFGSAAAVVFALIVANRLRKYALPFVLAAAALLPFLESPGAVSESVTTYLMRGQSEREFESMTGRTRAYENALQAFRDAPILGRGQWADRMVIGEHVHNSYLQALLNAGALGAIPYIASWITGWYLFFRLQKKTRSLSPEDRLCLLEAGTVMMFFTVRAMPETTTASFAPDLLVMAAVYVYLEALHRKPPSLCAFATPDNSASYVSREEFEPIYESSRNGKQWKRRRAAPPQGGHRGVCLQPGPRV